MNLTCLMIQKIASILDQKTADIDVIEIHHKDKLDIPSGTGLLLATSAAKGRNVDHTYIIYNNNKKRNDGTIGLSSIRTGDVIGEHMVIFSCKGERLEIIHKASSRVIFAQGAIQAALWIQKKSPALYSMFDMVTNYI